MDVKPGYKQTEVGVIPEDWAFTTVGQLVHDGVIAKPIDGNHGNIHPKSEDFVSFGIPFVMANNIRGGQVDLTNCSFIRKEQADTLQKGFSIPGDVLLTHKATIGNTAIVGDIPSEYIMLTPQVTYYRVLDRTRLNNSYIRQFFDSFSFQSILITMSGGGTRAYIGITAQLQLPVVLPPTIAEQEAIAAALSDADALIESLEQLIAKKRNIKQGAMQELLRPKDGWSETSLFQLARGKKEFFDDGDWIESEHVTDEGIRLIQTGNIGIGQFVEKNEKKYIFEASFNSLRCKEINEGDLLICRLAEPAGRACVLPHINESKVVTSVDVTIFRPPSENVNRVFLGFLFSTGQWFQEVSDRSGGTTHKRISRGALGRIKIKLPSIAEQNSIAEVLSDMDAELSTLESKLSKARQIKRGMMQELLTGRIRLV